MQLWIIGIIGLLLVLLLERGSRVRVHKEREVGILRLDPTTLDEVRGLAQRGKRTEARKLYRRSSGADRKSARSAVADLERRR